MRTYPDMNDKWDAKEVEQLNAEQWMIDALKMNPEYVFWGPYEDYMWKEGSGWNSRVIKDTWEDFGPWQLDELNEIVNFYFEVERKNVECPDCKGCGYNPETRKLSEDWYSFDREDWLPLPNNRRFNNAAWKYHLTQTEVDALWDGKRLQHDFDGEKPTPEQVNEWAKVGMGHDCINQSICVKARAKERGVFGYCAKCDGEGRVFTEPSAKLGLVLWVLHPRKGCSRGIHVKEIRRDEMPSVASFLKEAAQRNADRFSNVAA